MKSDIVHSRPYTRRCQDPGSTYGVPSIGARPPGPAVPRTLEPRGLSAELVDVDPLAASQSCCRLAIAALRCLPGSIAFATSGTFSSAETRAI